MYLCTCVTVAGQHLTACVLPVLQPTCVLAGFRSAGLLGLACLPAYKSLQAAAQVLSHCPVTSDHLQSDHANCSRPSSNPNLPPLHQPAMRPINLASALQGSRGSLKVPFYCSLGNHGGDDGFGHCTGQQWQSCQSAGLEPHPRPARHCRHLHRFWCGFCSCMPCA